MESPTLETHFCIVNFLSGRWLRWWRRFGLYLLVHDRWLSNWSWLRSCNWFWFWYFNLWWLSNFWFCCSLLFLFYISPLGTFFICLLINLLISITHWLRLDINNILIYRFLRILYASIFILDLHKPSWPRWYKLIHLLQHWINLHLRRLNNLVSYSFFHQVNFTLPDNFHQLIL